VQSLSVTQYSLSKLRRGLGARDLMIIYGITAKESELASAGIQSFLGFFDQRYRDHDYDVARDHAQKILLDSLLGLPGQTGPLNFTPGTLGTIDDSLNGPQLRRLTPGTSRSLRPA
jgi:hypothetical protein